MFDGRKSPVLKREDATRQKHLAQRMGERRELYFIPLKRAARYLVRKHQAALRCRRQEHVDKISLRGQRFRSRPSVEKQHYGIGCSDRQSHSEIWIHSSELDSPERWRRKVLRSGENEVKLGDP